MTVEQTIRMEHHLGLVCPACHVRAVDGHEWNQLRGEESAYCCVTCGHQWEAEEYASTKPEAVAARRRLAEAAEQEDPPRLERDTAAWREAWAELAARQPGQWQGDMECEDEETGEVWQYMGSFYVGDGHMGGVHEFRHRCHPATGVRMVEWIAVQDDNN